MQPVVLNKVCTACGVERRRKGIAYHPETFMPYCENPYLCNEKHPNSAINLAKRAVELGSPEKAQIKLLTFEEAKEKLGEWIANTYEDAKKVERIRRMVIQPVSVRIGTPELAEFILNLKEDMGFSSVSDAIRYCIERMQESIGRHVQQYKEKREEIKTEQEVQKALENPAPVEEESEDDDELVF